MQQPLLTRCPGRLLLGCSRCSGLIASRAYATHPGGATSRKQVTVINDDGRVKWTDLSLREKAARSTQKGLYLSVILTGMIMTVLTL
jgi:import inner membrane translocase subunit TIM21